MYHSSGLKRRIASRALQGFTLIEMLIVLLIVAVLSGMVFALIGLIGSSTDKATTRKRVEMLANAVEEFRAEYGKYPPVPQYREGGTIMQPIYYEWPVCTEGMTLKMTEDGVYFGIPESGANRIMQSSTAADYADAADAKGRLFTFGLASFLMTRYEGRDYVYQLPGYTNGFAVASPKVLTDKAQKNKQWFDHNSAARDGERDRRAAARFKYYVDQAGTHGPDWRQRSYDDSLRYRNRYITFRDAWRQPLRYESHPPYDSYKLWSVGPDGQDGTDDDIVIGKEGL